MNVVFYFIFHFIVFIFFTLATQIGGVLYFVVLYIHRKYKLRKRMSFALFVTVYLLFTFLIVPPLASLFGRTQISHTDKMNASNYMTVLLNRNYVRKDLNELLIRVSKKIGNPNLKIQYLDAGFPFINGFPLPPHLSHNDGRKVDISFVYEEDQLITNKLKSFTGYGVFVDPKAGEINQTEICKQNGYFQYDFPKYLSFGSINDHLTFSEKGTKKLTDLFLKESEVQKIFIEPHLKNRLDLNHPKVRFHGCGAVRHDDHIHLQIK